ncbi:hypothetical protein C8F01DRAFT_1237720 [Mycena amicta]|nr:hypothetical protein C8F01DRAFT_1237720 [Mycena amicta]
MTERRWKARKSRRDAAKRGKLGEVRSGRQFTSFGGCHGTKCRPAALVPTDWAAAQGGCGRQFKDSGQQLWELCDTVGGSWAAAQKGRRQLVSDCSDGMEITQHLRGSEKNLT